MAQQKHADLHIKEHNACTLPVIHGDGHLIEVLEHTSRLGDGGIAAGPGETLGGFHHNISRVKTQDNLAPAHWATADSYMQHSQQVLSVTYLQFYFLAACYYCRLKIA